MLRTSTVFACLVGSALALVATTSTAGVLAVNPLAFNDGNGPAGGAWRGTAPFVNGGLLGTVDWAVFTRANFDLAFPLNGYVSPANELVYAHQVFSAGPLIGVSGMDIELGGGAAGNGGSYSVSGIPLTEVPAIFAYADPSIASWILATETDPTTPSEGLVYSSPNSPQLTGIPVVIDGGSSASVELPIGIPVPEPSTFIFASIVTAVWSMFRRTRRD